MEENTVKEAKKAKLGLPALVLVTIAATLLTIVVARTIYFLVTGV